MKEYLAYFETKCAGSKKMIGEAKTYIPGGVQHNLAFNYPFPLAIAKADGPYLYDVDGNRYIDYIGSWGPMILGHSHPAVYEAVVKAAEDVYKRQHHYYTRRSTHENPRYSGRGKTHSVL